MSEWNVCSIDELGSVNRGKSKHRPRNDVILFGGLYPFIQTSDVKNANLYISEYDTTYSEIGLAQSKLWKKGTLCITIAANIAESAILGIDACFPDSVVGFMPYEGKADLKFVKYMLDEFKVYMQQISKGTTQDNLSLEKLRRIKFYVPSYETQQKIANILSRYDEAIENNNKRIELLEQMAQNLYKECFVRFRFPGYENSEFENGIPVGWKVERIGELYHTTSGGTPSRNHEEYYQEGTYPWIKTGELKDCPIIDTEEYITEDAIKHSSAKVFEKDSLIIAMYGATIGQLGINKMSATCNQACCVLRPKENRAFGIYYLFNFFKENRDFIIGLGNGAAQQNLSQILINKIKILNPPKEVLEPFEKMQSVFFEKIYFLQRANKNLAKQRDLLLPRLMSGKLEVR
ncbi:MAG: restriction endonuclease subunit S [Clostridia bacterium]|nr:restriction endonuclease subunit S [Clostridia bacterium]